VLSDDHRSTRAWMLSRGAPRDREGGAQLAEASSGPHENLALALDDRGIGRRDPRRAPLVDKAIAESSAEGMVKALVDEIRQPITLIAGPYSSVMAPIRTARFREHSGSIWIPGAREFSVHFGDDENLHVLLADLVDVSLSSLRRVVNAFRDRVGERWLFMYFYAQEPESFEPTISPREPFNLEFFGDQLRVRAQYVAPAEQPTQYPELLNVIARLLQQRKARVMRTEHSDEFGRVRHDVRFEFASLRGLRVHDAHQVSADVSTLAAAVARRGSLDARAIADIVLAGQASLLVGQHEHQDV
jgi:hypothetical protein